MKHTIFVLIATVAVSCTTPTTDESDRAVAISQNTKKPYVSHTYYLTDSNNSESLASKAYEDTLKLFYAHEETNYLPLYKFSSDIIALQYYFGEGTEVINELAEEILDESYLDAKSIGRKSEIALVSTTDYGNFYKYSPATERILKTYQDDYTVLCTKGVIQRKIEDLYFVYNDCYSLELFLVVRPIDKTIYGEPISMVVSNNFEIEEIDDASKLKTFYNQFDDFLNRNGDYVEPAKHFELLGKHGAYYIGYNDDFNWQKGTERKMFYPERVIFKKVDGQFKIVNITSLDLFGIPCD